MGLESSHSFPLVAKRKQVSGVHLLDFCTIAYSLPVAVFTLHIVHQAVWLLAGFVLCFPCLLCFFGFAFLTVNVTKSICGS